jgi:DNA repair ATPase RecN
MTITAETISFVLSLLAIGGLVWRTATENERVKSSIKDVRDELRYTYDIQLEKLTARIDRVEYDANHTRELLQHKSNRYEQEIANLKAYLQKKFDFQTRRRHHPIEDDDDGPSTGPI